MVIQKPPFKHKAKKSTAVERKIIHDRRACLYGISEGIIQKNPKNEQKLKAL
jgi:hypothetical protein